MSPFDLDALLNARLEAEQKRLNLAAASEQKKAELAPQTPATPVVNDQDSWVRKLGLNEDNILGRAVNLGASAYQGLGTLAGQLASLIPGTIAAADQANLTEQDLAALDRFHKGQASPADMAQINRKVAPPVVIPGGITDPEMRAQVQARAQAMTDQNPNAPTPLSIWKDMNVKRESARNIVESTDYKDTVLQSKQTAFNEELGAGFDPAWSQVKEGGVANVTAGLAKLIYNAGAVAAGNPQASLEYVVQNLPQLAVGGVAGKAGKVALGASNVGYALDNYNQGIQNYQAQHGGELPPEDVRQKMALQAASLAIAEHAGDTAALAFAGKGKDAVTAGFKQSLKNAGKAAGEGLLTEAPTEGFQTYMEGEVTGKPASAKDIYAGAAIGGIAGAGLSGGGRLVAEATGATPEQAQVREEKQAAAKVVADAAQTGNVDALIDPKKQGYAPDDAVIALLAHAKQETTTPAQKQANLAKAQKVVSELQASRDKAQEVLDAVSPEVLTDQKQQLQSAQQQLAILQPGTPAHSSTLDLIQGLQESLDNQPEAKVLAEMQARVARMDEKLAKAKSAYDQLGVVASPAAEVQSHIEKVTATVTPDDAVATKAARDAADALITLSMASPGRLDPQQALSLADNATNALTDEQRNYLRAFADSRVAENRAKTLGGVEAEIYVGGKGYQGIDQYRTRVAAALASGDQKEAGRVLALLAKFAADHQAKARAAEDADVGGQIVRTKAGEWVVNNGPRLSDKQMAQNGGLTISTDKWLTQLPREAEAINKALAELKAGYDLKFSQPKTTTTTGGTNVQNAPQGSAAGAGTQGQAAQRAPAKDGAGGAAVQDAGPAAAGASNAVESAGLKSEAGAAVVASGSTVETENTVSQSPESTAVDSRAEGQNQSNPKDTSLSAAQDAPAAPVEVSKADLAESVTNSEQSALQAESQSTEAQAQTVESGELRATRDSAGEGATHRTKKFGDFFTQVKGSIKDGSLRPLVAVKDFMSKWAAKAIQLREYLKDKDGLTEEQQSALRMFALKAKAWAGEIQKNLKPSHNEAFNFEDPIRYLIVDGDVEENVKTGITAAVFAWIGDQAGRLDVNLDADINSILGHSEDDVVSQLARETLGQVGSYQSMLVDSLGSRVLDALGLKARKDAPQDMIAKLRVSLGAHALKLLEDQGIVIRTDIDAQLIHDLRYEGVDNPPALANKQPHHFFRLARDGQRQLTGQAKEIADTLKGSQNIIGSLFGIESAAKLPSVEPVKQVQQKSDTDMGVPDLIRKVIKQNQTDNGRVVAKDPMKVLSALTEEMALEMAGVVEVTAENTHGVNRKGKEAKNDGYRREFKSFMDFVSEVLVPNGGVEQPFFLTYNMWKQQRVGIETTAVNPQTSKIHRWLTVHPDWKTTVPVEGGPLLTGFKLRVAEGLGIKTEKGASQKSVAAVEAQLQEPVFVAGVQALQQALYGATELDAKQQRAIVNAVLAGKEKLHTLAALIAWAHYQQALATGAKEFTTDLMGEVDGVANGTMLNHVLYGAGETVEDLQALLERGGFFTEDSEFRQYNIWRGTAGNADIYEHTAKDIDRRMRGMLGEGKVPAGVISAIWNVAGRVADDAGVVTKAGRDLVKGALNPLNFGSGFKSIRRGMAQTFIEGVYAQLEQFSVKQASQERVDDFIANLNTLLQHGGAPTLKVGQPIAKYMDARVLSDRQLKALRKAYGDTMGEATASVVEKAFAPFIEKRKALTTTTSLAYELYNAVYQAARGEFMDELGIERNKAGVPLHDLSAEQEAQLKEKLAGILPVMHTAMSQDDGNLAHGILLARRERGPVDSPAYETAVGFAQPLGNGAKQLTARGQAVQQTGPGVLAVSASTHSLDSKISHLTQLGRNILNIHDAVGDGVGTLAKTAQAFNQSTWESLLGYSPMTAAYDALARVVSGIAAMQDAGTLTPAAVANLRQVFEALASKKQSPEQVLADAMGKAFDLARQADTTKLQAMSQWAVVDQYAFDGGSYEVTDADRKAAAEKLAAVPQMMDPSHMEALGLLHLAVFAKPAPAIQAAPVAVPAPKTSPFGELGRSAVASDTGLVAFLDGGDKSGTEMVAYLKGAGLSPANQKLLALVARVLPNDLAFRLVKPDTAVDAVIAPAQTPSRGWYVAGQGRHEVNFLSPAFKASGLTAETVLHEMLHGVLARYLWEQRTSKQPDPAAKQLIDELEALREQAKAMDKDGRYAAATENLDEFISWGMTNEAFQRDILASMYAPSKSGGNRLLNGLQKFIKALTGLLGKAVGNPLFHEAETGLALLVANVSGLVQAVAQTQGLQNPQEQTEAASINRSMAAVDAFTTQAIHEALADANRPLEPRFEAHLSELLSGIVDALHGPFGAFAEALKPYAPTSPREAWLKAQQTGLAPFASRVLANLPVSDQEAFAIEQVEATVRAALKDNSGHTKLAYQELSDLFTEAQQTLKPSDFASPAHYDFIFKVEADNGDKSEYLARFAALALAHQGVNKLLQVPSKDRRTVSEGKTFADKVQIVFENILAFFARMATHTYDGQNLDEKLQTLVGQLVDIEAKNREAIKDGKARVNYLEPLENAVTKASEATMKKVEQVAGSDFFRKSKSGIVKGSAAVVRTVAGHRQQQFYDALQQFRDRTMNERGGILSSLLREVAGVKEWAEKSLRLVKHREAQRKSLISNSAKFALESFVNEGKDLSSEAKASVTRVFMRTGLHNLLDHFGFNEMEQLLTSQPALDQAIAQFEARLPARLRRLYVEQARILGHFKATGQVKGFLMPNAHVIARMLDTRYEAHASAVAEEHEDSIKVLASLFALKSTDVADKTRAAAVLSAETARQDGGNGVDFLLRTLKKLEADALERLFGGNPVLMQHGYTPEIFNPHTAFEVAGEERGKDLLAQGFSEGAKVQDDLHDPVSQKQRIYVRRGAARARWDSGIMSLTDTAAKGSQLHNGFLHTGFDDGRRNAQRQAAVTAGKLSLLDRRLDPHRDLELDRTHHMAPVYNEHGKVVNWRHLMEEQTKDDILQRNNDFDAVLGTLAGSVFDKQTTPAQNSEAVQALKAQFDADRDVNRQKGYFLVGVDSTDPQLKEIWRLLPEKTKQEVNRVWGFKGMYVHNDMLDVMFGYRAASAAEFLRKDKDTLKGVQAIVRGWFDLYARSQGMDDREADNYAKKLGWYLARGEEAWKEIVKETKDIIVVKSGVVLIDNVLSNFTQLALSGVPLRDFVRHHLVAMRGAVAFERDSNELQRLQQMLDTGYLPAGNGTRSDIERQVARLKDALARNPVKELMEAGLMPTIVEDVAQENDPYSYKTEWARRTERFTKALNPGVVAAAKQVYMTHDTKTYQAMSRMTRLSDFMARYALYQHLVTKKDPMTKEQALQRASETFINYDVPMHRGMQYLDNMGLFMFTKYFLRIQRVLTRTMRENPGRVLGLMALDHYMSIGPNVLDGSFLHHLGNNPWSWGALQYPGALDRLATVSVPMSLIK